MTRRILIGFFAGLLVAPSVFGQAEEMRLPTPEKGPEMLQIEVLIFKHLDVGDAAQSAQSAQVLYDMQDLPMPPLPEAQAFLIPGEARPPGFSEIYAVFSDKHRLLLNEAQKMRASKRIQFLHHIAWMQPLPKAGDAQYVRLLAEQSRGVLSGVARVTPGKYNRIEVLLRYDLDSNWDSNLGSSLGSNLLPTVNCVKPADNQPCIAATPSSSTEVSRVPPSSRVLHIDLLGLTPDDQLLYMDHPILAALAIVTRTTRPPPDASPIYPNPADSSTPSSSLPPAHSSPTQSVE